MESTTVKWVYQETKDNVTKQDANKGNISLLGDIRWSDPDSNHKVTGIQKILVQIPDTEPREYEITLYNISNKKAAFKKMNSELKKLATLAIMYGVGNNKKISYKKGEYKRTKQDGSGQKVKKLDIKAPEAEKKLSEDDIHSRTEHLQNKYTGHNKQKEKTNFLQLAAVVNEYVRPGKPNIRLSSNGSQADLNVKAEDQAKHASSDDGKISTESENSEEGTNSKDSTSGTNQKSGNDDSSTFSEGSTTSSADSASKKTTGNTSSSDDKNNSANFKESSTNSADSSSKKTTENTSSNQDADEANSDPLAANIEDVSVNEKPGFDRASDDDSAEVEINGSKANSTSSDSKNTKDVNSSPIKGWFSRISNLFASQKSNPENDNTSSIEDNILSNNRVEESGNNNSESNSENFKSAQSRFSQSQSDQNSSIDEENEDSGNFKSWENDDKSNPAQSRSSQSKSDSKSKNSKSNSNNSFKDINLSSSADGDDIESLNKGNSKLENSELSNGSSEDSESSSGMEIVIGAGASMNSRKSNASESTSSEVDEFKQQVNALAKERKSKVQSNANSQKPKTSLGLKEMATPQLMRNVIQEHLVPVETQNKSMKPRFNGGLVQMYQKYSQMIQTLKGNDREEKNEVIERYKRLQTVKAQKQIRELEKSNTKNKSKIAQNIEIQNNLIKNINTHGPEVIIKTYRNTCITLLRKIFQASVDVYNSNHRTLDEDLKEIIVNAAQYAYTELQKWDETKVQANNSKHDKRKKVSDHAYSALTMIKEQNFLGENGTIDLDKGNLNIFLYSDTFSFNNLVKSHKERLKKNHTQSK